MHKLFINSSLAQNYKTKFVFQGRRYIGTGKSEEDTKRKVDEVLRLENWRGFVNGKATGGLAVLDVLGIEKEKRVEVLAEALGLCNATATEFVNSFYEGNYRE